MRTCLECKYQVKFHDSYMDDGMFYVSCSKGNNWITPNAASYCDDFEPKPEGIGIIMKGGNIMGYSNKAKAADANADKVNDKNFITINDISIDRANEIKDGVVIFDIAVGHIKIYGMSMCHMTSKDGQEWDAISFPARKAENGKYYDIAWFPMSAELKAQVAEKVIAKLNA